MLATSVPRSFVQVADEWRPIAGDHLAWTPHFFQPTGETLKTYVSGQHAVAVYVAYYGAGDRGAKLASSANELFSGRWMPISDSRRSISVQWRHVRGARDRRAGREYLAGRVELVLR